jgi:hypothetical protein
MLSGLTSRGKTYLIYRRTCVRQRYGHRPRAIRPAFQRWRRSIAASSGSRATSVWNPTTTLDTGGEALGYPVSPPNRFARFMQLEASADPTPRSRMNQGSPRIAPHACHNTFDSMDDVSDARIRRCDDARSARASGPAATNRRPLRVVPLAPPMLHGIYRASTSVSAFDPSSEIVASRGSDSVNTAPPPGASSTSRRPPCASASRSLR